MIGAVKGVVRGRAAGQGASSEGTVRGSLCKVGADTREGRGGENPGRAGRKWVPGEAGTPTTRGAKASGCPGSASSPSPVGRGARTCEITPRTCDFRFYPCKGAPQESFLVLFYSNLLCSFFPLLLAFY